MIKRSGKGYFKYGEYTVFKRYSKRQGIHYMGLAIIVASFAIPNDYLFANLIVISIAIACLDPDLRDDAKSLKNRFIK